MTTALHILDYLHAPMLAFCFLGAYIFAFCTLQTPVSLSFKERWTSIILMLALVISYITQATYYLIPKKYGQAVPQHSGIHVLGSILAWGLFTITISKAKSILWQPYLGVFILEVLFEAALCILGATHDQLRSTTLSLGALRIALSVILMIHGLLLGFRNRLEKHTDEEEQILLNSDTGYGSLPSGQNRGENRDRDIEEQQRQRLQQEGGWVGYIRGFGLFLPYLWPSDDWRVMACLGLRLSLLGLERVLKPLVPYCMGAIIEHLVSGSTVMPWKQICLWSFGQLLQGSAGFANLDIFASTYIQNYSYTRITNKAFGHIMRLSMDFHSSKNSGEITKAMEQASSLNTVLEVVLFRVPAFVIDIIVSLWLITHWYNAYLAFGALLTGIAQVCVGIRITTWTMPTRRACAETDRNKNSIANESIMNWQTVTYFNRVPFEQDRYRNIVQAAVSAEYANMFCSCAGFALQSLLRDLSYSGCFTFAIWEIIQGETTVGSLVTLLFYWRSVIAPMMNVVHSYKGISTALINAERLLQLLTTKPSVVDQELPQELSAVSSCKVEFKHVDFAYDKRNPVLREISFVAESGHTVGIVGESGGGKSTILRLIFRLQDVNNGSIMFNGQDIRCIKLSSLHDVIGFVPQDPSMFNMTVRGNLRYARLDATDKEIEEACVAAGVHDRIKCLPDGYESIVGEQGVRLSGGERQRIAIARVLLKNSRVILLDEATSAVDSSTEALIQTALKRLSSGRTTFMVAHRLSTIVHADTILVMDDGMIVERGTHTELIEKGGRYAELWRKQTEVNQKVD